MLCDLFILGPPFFSFNSFPSFPSLFFFFLRALFPLPLPSPFFLFLPSPVSKPIVCQSSTLHLLFPVLLKTLLGQSTITSRLAIALKPRHSPKVLPDFKYGLRRVSQGFQASVESSWLATHFVISRDDWWVSFVGS